MNLSGDLNVTDNILSGGTNLLDIFITENGGWTQEITDMVTLVLNNQEYFKEKLSGCTSTGSTVTIVKTTNLPQDTHIELYNPHPDIIPSPKIKERTIINKPAARVIQKPAMEIYQKCCGTWDGGSQRYRDCMKRVDHCYQYIKECKGSVTTNDMSMYKIKLSDCGCSYDPKSHRC